MMMIPNTMWAAFAQLFLMQAVIAAFVIYVLKKILDHQLVELSLKKFKNICLTPEDEKLNGIMVISSGRLKKSLQRRIRHTTEEKFKRPMQVLIKKDRSLMGGIMICLNSTIIDYSILGRLREGRILKTKT